MLTEDWWLTDFGSWQMGGSEHSQFAAAVMLGLFPDRRVPLHWIIKGIPEHELVAALERGADPKAVEFLSHGKSDPRLYALRELGWVRVARSHFNLWRFDKKTAALVRNAKDYWKAQDKSTAQYEMIDVVEFETGDRYTISAKKLLDGGDPQILKGLAMGTLVDDHEEAAAVSYPTDKYTELERKKLYRREGDNPSLEAQAAAILRPLMRGRKR